MAVTQNMIDNTRRFEGVIYHMYLDTTNNVTVGVGFLLVNSAAGANLGFVKRSNGQAATAADVAADWTAVHKQAPNNNHTAAHYRQFTQLDLPDAAVNTALRTKLGTFETELGNIFNGYDAFPAAAKEGLIDMIFNLGSTRLQNSFPTFCTHVRAQNWAGAATECRRTQVSQERNDFVAALFNSAGTR